MKSIKTGMSFLDEIKRAKEIRAKMKAVGNSRLNKKDKPPSPPKKVENKVQNKLL